MNVTAAQAKPAQSQTTISSYDVQEQTDGQLLITTRPARVPTFTFDSAIIIGGFAFTTLAIDYFLIGIGGYLATLITTAIGAVAAWGCLKILHRERRKGISPGRFYVSNVSINIPPPDNQSKSILLLGGNIDRIMIRQTVSHTETSNYAFGSIGARGMEAKDRRTGWFADHSYIVEAQSQGRTYVLATGLDEVTAHGLMQSVSRKLGF